jgi:hypothetical protein
MNESLMPDVEGAEYTQTRKLLPHAIVVCPVNPGVQTRRPSRA